AIIREADGRAGRGVINAVDPRRRNGQRAGRDVGGGGRAAVHGVVAGIRPAEAQSGGCDRLARPHVPGGGGGRPADVAHGVAGDHSREASRGDRGRRRAVVHLVRGGHRSRQRFGRDRGGRGGCRRGELIVAGVRSRNPDPADGDRLARGDVLV